MWLCVCGHVGYLITHCGVPSCLHLQINKAGKESRSKQGLRWREREWDATFKMTFFWYKLANSFTTNKDGRYLFPMIHT